MTWIEVVDSAVKIGLGALIAGVIAFLLASTQHRNELKKAKVEREFEMPKQVAEKVEIFNHVALKFWSLSSDWRRKLLLDSTTPLTNNLLDSQNNLFNGFSELTKAESLLLLFGYEKAQISLREYGESVVSFKKRVSSIDISFNEDDAASYRETMIDKRSELFSLLNEIYKTI